MQKFNGSLIRQFPSLVTGNAAAGVQVSVRIGTGSTLATLYATNNTAGAQLPNPITTDAKGFYSFYAVDGQYNLQFNNGFPALEIQLIDAVQTVSDINSGAGLLGQAASAATQSINQANALISQANIELQQAIDGLVNSGWFPVTGSFTLGATITERNQVLFNDADSSFYGWSGALPKVVSSGSTPASSGGIGSTAWVNRGDAALRSALAATDSDVLVGGIEAGDLAKGEFSLYARDFDKIVFGREYLQHFINAARNNVSSPVKIIHSGDSTTASAWGEPDPVLGGYTPSSIMTYLAESYGVRASNINAGYSGQDTVSWNALYVNDDLFNHPDVDLYIVRWGINDGATHGNPATFETALRSGLQQIRTFKGDNVSILLMSPNNTFDTPNNRDRTWYESIQPALRKAARDFKCTYFDTYALLNDAENGADLWMDNPFSDGRTVHPFAEFTASIYSDIAKIIFEPAVALRKNLNRFSNVHSGDFILSVSSTNPDSFPFGKQIYRAIDFPFDGVVEVTKSADGIIHQVNIGRSNGRLARRTYNPESTSWTDFSVEAAAEMLLYTAQSGFDSSAAKIVAQGNVIVSQGFISCTSQTIAAGTHIATLTDITKACSTDSAFFTATVWGGGATWGSCLFQVNGLSAGADAGKVVAVNATPFAVQRVYLNASWSNL